MLSARDDPSGRLDHFYWAFTEELATRAGITRGEFEDAQRHTFAGLPEPIWDLPPRNAPN